MTTLYDQTMRALERSLHCSLIASKLDFDHGVMQVDVDDERILEYALANRFSRIPLFSRVEGDEKVVTDVAIVDLERVSVDSPRTLNVEDILAGSTPISEAIHLLWRRPFYFVLEGSRIRRILTVSDLNRLPVRTYLHTLLDHLEWLLAECVEATYPNDSWMPILSNKRQEKILDLHERKRRQDFDTRLIHCTTLSEKATVVGKSEELLRALSQESRTAFDGRFKEIGRLRNRVGHALPPLDKEAESLRDQVRHGGLLTKRADVEWLHRVVGTMETWIDTLSTCSETTEAGEG